MTRWIAPFLSALLVLAPTSARAQQAPAPSTDVDRLAAACNDFAGRLAREIDPDRALTVAPGSIAVALHMLLPGARGETADELARLLGLPDDLRGERLLDAVRALLAHEEKPDGARLRIQNDVWVQQGQPITDAYLAAVRRAFAAAPTALDFVADPDAARRRINAHIAAATNDRIRELLQPTHVDAGTRVVLTNAFWFRGAWTHAFPARATTPRPFRLADGRVVDVPTMQVVETFRRADGDGFAAVVLPFSGSTLQFEVLVPTGEAALATAERALVTGAHLPALANRPVRLRMPRFRAAGKFELRPVLERLGMRASFDPRRADFSGMSGGRDLVVSEVVHEAWIDVDEAGAEAAAATAVIMKRGAAVTDPAPFDVDRPFVFGLRDRRTGLLWFVGRVLDPRAES